MAFDAFLKLSTIPGESTDDKHKDWIELLSFSHGLSQPTHGSSAAGAATSGRVDVADFNIMKMLDKASPKLSLACCNGEHIQEATVELCRAGKDKQKYMEIKMSDVVISSVRPAGTAQGSEGLPVEEVGLRFTKIEWQYTATDPKTGRGTGQVKAMWDLKANKGN